MYLAANNTNHRQFMSHPGVIVGILFVGVVFIVAWLLARKANHGVRHFRPDHHVNFVGRKPE